MRELLSFHTEFFFFVLLFLTFSFSLLFSSFLYSSSFFLPFFRSLAVRLLSCLSRSSSLPRFLSPTRFLSFFLSLLTFSPFYIAFTEKSERNCHIPVPGRNCMTHCQALQDFSRYESGIAP
jgi:hypothetical protein